MPRLSLQVEILALRHQLALYQRACARPRLRPADRILAARSPWQNPFVERLVGSIRRVVEIEHLGGLHHHYERAAA